ncbi:hypothetical protein DZF91_33605 [Actinomadura logoneensis]|uniref:Type II secretion system protein GspF domain-containing protein n=1 Tax=Actinomadura logoneensis TaxID=2293572 RepID=A0A372JBD1_9ACTN|nr:type II secretion system F family protein [Actinomadura logoneensis]RFU37303.1 hypothetical protein DZF91_33605 [Actinomadura logoneensis]
MNLPLPAILAILALTLVLATWGVGDLLTGWGQRRRLVSRAELGIDTTPNGPLVRLDRVLRRTSAGKSLARRLHNSGLRIRVSTFVLLLSAVALLAVFVIGQWIGAVYGIAAAVGVAFLFLSYLRRREDRRKEEFIAQLPELARVLSNATQAGLVMTTAIEIAADELSEPAGEELKRTADALRLGQPLEEALHDLGERLPSRELGVLISTLVVSARAGGSLVTALRTISTTLEDRKEIRREVLTIMGEATVTNVSVIGLSIVALGLINVIQPGALRAMSHHLIGQVILVIALSLFVGSVVIVRRITRIDV